MRYKLFYLRGLISLFLVFVVLSNAYGFKIRYTWNSGQKYVYLEDVAAYYGMKLQVFKNYCILNSRYSNIILNNKNKEFRLNGTNVYSSLPINNYNRKPIISETDFLLLIDPVLRNATLKRHGFAVNSNHRFTVIIDPGHGGKDTGAAGKHCKERDIVLQIAFKLKYFLEKHGFKVYLTRNSNKVFVPLKLRPAMCARYGGDLFISIHCNATTGSSGTSGVETYICTSVGTKSTSGGSIVSVKQNGNINDKNNARLGYEIQKHIIHSGHTKIDRGVKHAQFAVLKYCPVPAVLVETGFVTNPREEYLLRQSSYQTEIAQSISNGIIAYCGAMMQGKG